MPSYRIVAKVSRALRLLATAWLVLGLSCAMVSRSTRDPLVVAAVSCESRIRDTTGNLARMERWARAAAGRGAELILFPECSVHGWWLSRENRAFAESIDGPSIERLVRLARELDVVLVFGITELDGERAFITQVVVDGNGVLGKHRKSSLAGGVGGEATVWESGDDVGIFTIDGYRIGIAICFESVHPETCAALRAGGAEIILAPYSNGTRPQEILRRERSRRWIWERVRENRLWYVACDATPHDERGALQPGAAFVISPDGELVACTPERGPGEAMVICEIP